MSSRTPGEGRYAHLEREQRWRLAEPPLGLVERCEILDCYLNDTTLRLRRVTRDDGIVYKLTQKVRADPADPEMVKITNMYLTPGEYEALRELPSSPLRKFRSVYSLDQRDFAVDVFADRHEGLVLAETELGTHEHRVSMPSFAMDEVSNDHRYSGGALAHASDDAIRLLVTVCP